MDEQRAKVEPLLRRFGEVELKPTDGYLTEAKRLGQKVFEVLKWNWSREDDGEYSEKGEVSGNEDVDCSEDEEEENLEDMDYSEDEFGEEADLDGDENSDEGENSGEEYTEEESEKEYSEEDFGEEDDSENEESLNFEEGDDSEEESEEEGDDSEEESEEEEESSEEGNNSEEEEFCEREEHEGSIAYVSVAETHFAGSIGKKTNILTPDLDLVIVLNNCLPPFDDVLEEIQQLLKANQSHLVILPNSIGSTNYSTYFKFTNGIEVDLLPAAKLNPKDIYDLLRSKAMLGDKDRKEYSRMYSSSLVKKQLGFPRSHESSFVHVVIRIAKFWFKSLHFGGNMNGGSTIMELIGVAAAEKVEAAYGHGRPSVLTALDVVMDMVINLNKLKLAFKEVGDGGKWERVPQIQFSELPPPHWIPGVVGTDAMFGKKCFIIEPANPFNDLLEDKDASYFHKFCKFATETKSRLARLRMGQYVQGNGEEDAWMLNIDKLFKPQG